jgi:hypothetical protein
VTTTPSWLETAAKLDALAGDKVSLSAVRAAAEKAVGETTELSAEAPKPAPRPEAATAVPAARMRVVEPPVVKIPAPAAATAEEVDLAWHGYSAAALVPSTIALAAATVSAFVILRPLVPAIVVHEAADAPLAALWILQAIRAGYRLVAYSYRLTTRRLLRSRGRLYPMEEPLELVTLGTAMANQSLLGKLFDIGMVRVFREDGSAAAELPGVRRPKVLAARIEEAATAARGANISMARLPAAAISAASPRQTLSEPQ